MKSTSARNTGRKVAISSLAVGLGIALSVAGAGQANADPITVGLGAAESFAVLGHTTVTNTGPSTISGDLGVIPGSSATGFPPGQMITGNIHISDGPAGAAIAALGTAYTDAAGRTPPDGAGLVDLAGMSLTGGLYQGGALANTGTLTLDGGGDASSVWIFQASSTLITDAGSKIELIGDANPCNVFWQVASSATLGTNSTMVGTVMAQQSIAATTGATVNGRLLALNGAVTLDSNTITVPSACAGTVAPGGTKTSPAVTLPVVPKPAPVVPKPAPVVPKPAPVVPKLAKTGLDVGPYIIGILTLVGGGVALLMFNGNEFRRRRGGRLSE